MRSGSRAAKGRRAFVATLVGGVLLARRRVEAQPAARIARIGFLTPSSVSPRGVLRDLRQKLGELGYVEGRDIVFEIRAANEDFERLPELAADLVRVNVD